MGTHTLSRLHCHSNFKCRKSYRGYFHGKKGTEQPSAVLLAFTTQSLWTTSIDKRNSKYKQTKQALFSPRAAQGAENGYAAATAWTSTSMPTPTVASARRNQFIVKLETLIEKVIFNCRFVTLLAVVGSLGGSILCFIQGCRFVNVSFFEYILGSWHAKDTSHVVLLLIEAIDLFLVATVMLIFGMGIYELFVNTIGLQQKDDDSPIVKKKTYTGSNLFGLFRLQDRPLWLEIRSLHELKTKIGHVIVMILLVGMFEKSKLVPICTSFDLLCFSASILLAAGCLLLLSKLHMPK